MKTFFVNVAVISFFLLGTTKVSAQNKYTDNKNITSLIKKKREYNKQIEANFEIQLYNGFEKKAKEIKLDFEKTFQNTNARLKFESPDWKVQVGNYQTRLEADRALNKVRTKFTGAIIIKK
ncbi:MAG: hypothetical protein CR961_00165 [Polaribacter sp.]|nr:MAG: hypothetical protein CR961_00165 [Polaribacter sp.]